jgi:hypothetical protein
MARSLSSSFWEARVLRLRRDGRSAPATAPRNMSSTAISLRTVPRLEP